MLDKITEAIQFTDKHKKIFLQKWTAEGRPYKEEIGENGENFIDWVKSKDPSRGKYTGWMIKQYVAGDLHRLEDIASTTADLLTKHLGLARKKKLKPEHKDINRFKTTTDLFEALSEYDVEDEDLLSRNEAEQAFYRDGEADLIHNGNEWKVIKPKTEKASCYFGTNTKWCTAAQNNNRFSYYNNGGPLYIFLHKKSNKRFQFHFETKEFMDELNKPISADVLQSIFTNKELFNTFKAVLPDGAKPTKKGWAWVVEDKWGTQEWCQNGELHRDDGPAYVSASGTQAWYQNGKFHRDNGPAIVKASGTQEWYQNGERHRDNGPAIVKANGDQEWYQNGKLHRDDGPAIVEPSGAQEWYQNDELHRDDGPAIVGANGYQEWYQNGQLHRDDGPAIVFANGAQAWWQNGERVEPKQISEALNIMNEAIQFTDKHKKIFLQKNTLNESQVLIEGRYEDVQAQYPELDERVLKFLSENDPSKNNKYLMWMAKEAQTYKPQIVVKFVILFDRKQKNLERKSIEQYEDLKDLASELADSFTSLDKVKTSTPPEMGDEEVEEDEGIKVVYEDDEFIVYFPKNFSEMKELGPETTWCVTKSEHTWGDYVGSRNLKFTVAFDKKAIDDKSNIWRKIALPFLNGEVYGREVQNIPQQPYSLGEEFAYKHFGEKRIEQIAKNIEDLEVDKVSITKNPQLDKFHDEINDIIDDHLHYFVMFDVFLGQGEDFYQDMVENVTKGARRFKKAAAEFALSQENPKQAYSEAFVIAGDRVDRYMGTQNPENFWRHRDIESIKARVEYVKSFNEFIKIIGYDNFSKFIKLKSNLGIVVVDDINNYGGAHLDVLPKNIIKQSIISSAKDFYRDLPELAVQMVDTLSRTNLIDLNKKQPFVDEYSSNLKFAIYVRSGLKPEFFATHMFGHLNKNSRMWYHAATIAAEDEEEAADTLDIPKELGNFLYASPGLFAKDTDVLQLRNILNTVFWSDRSIHDRLVKLGLSKKVLNGTKHSFGSRFVFDFIDEKLEELIKSQKIASFVHAYKIFTKFCEWVKENTRGLRKAHEKWEDEDRYEPLETLPMKLEEDHLKRIFELFSEGLDVLIKVKEIETRNKDTQDDLTEVDSLNENVRHFEDASGVSKQLNLAQLIPDFDHSIFDGPARSSKNAWYVSVNDDYNNSQSIGRNLFKHLGRCEHETARSLCKKPLFIGTADGQMRRMEAPMELSNLFASDDFEPEETIVIDFRNMNESVFTMFGAWIEYALRRLLAGAVPNIRLRGTPEQLKAFGKTLGAEKRYLETFVQNGLTDPKTYRSKSVLDKAVSNFEKKTGIKWPFK